MPVEHYFTKFLLVASFAVSAWAQASVIGKDDRQILSKNLQVVKFSLAEREQAMRCTGFIYCPQGTEGPAMQSAGAICPLGYRDSKLSCDADRLATAGHMFVNEKTNQMIPALELCEFRSYRGHVSKLIIDDIKVLSSEPAYNPRINLRADKLVVRLEKPIINCNPYDLADLIGPLPAGTEVIALTHAQRDQNRRRFTGSEPLAFPCKIMKSFTPNGGGPSAYYSDCDVNGVGSGGFLLARSSSQSLVVTSIIGGSGDEIQNGLPYNEETKNRTVSTGVDADFLELAAAPGIRVELRYFPGQRVQQPLQ